MSSRRINVKKYLNRLFIEGLSGMALGLFSTLIVGTILTQIAKMVGGEAKNYLMLVANIAKTITGAGIGVGVASTYKVTPLVTVSSAVAGMIGAFPNVENAFVLGNCGDPLGAFIASYVAIEIGRLVAGKTQLDIVLTPVLSIATGSCVGFAIGPYISDFMYWLGGLININVEKSPIIGGMIVSVVMGMLLTLPISSAAIGISMGISGLAGGAAVVGCCCQMVGFAAASYKENKMGGLIAQGVGTSMLQVPNIMKRPQIWIPPILASAILGPVSSAVLKMSCTSVGAGMGTSGFVGQFGTYEAMYADGISAPIIMVEIFIMHIVLPAILTMAIAESVRKLGWIRDGDMKLRV